MGVRTPIQVQSLRGNETVETTALLNTGFEADLPALLVISEAEHEAILNDAAIEDLQIELARPRARLWRFRGEAGERVGVGPQYW